MGNKIRISALAEDNHFVLSKQIKIEGRKIGKEEIKLLVLTEDIILCSSPFEIYIYKVLEISEFNKTMEYKVNKQNSAVILYILNGNFENEIC